MTDSGTNVVRLAGWLLSQNSLAARLLSGHPQLIGGRLEQLQPGRVPPLPPLDGDGDEEAAVGLLRRWWGEALLSLSLGLISGRLKSRTLTARLAEATARLTAACLDLADQSLRQRYHHPLLPADRPGPGPIIVLGQPQPVGADPGLDSAHSLLFLFARGQSENRPTDESSFLQSLDQPREFIILKDYVLKLAQRVMAYLTMDDPAGPGLNLAPPQGLTEDSIGPQISSFSRLAEFIRLTAGDAALIGLTRLTPLAGLPSVINRFRRLIREAVLARPWATERTGSALARLRTPPGDLFDPARWPGGLVDIGLALDGLLIQAGRLPRGDNAARLNDALAAGLIPDALGEEVARALACLERGHLILSLLGRDLAGRELTGQADLEAALALTPSKTDRPAIGLAKAREIGRELIGLAGVEGV